MTLIIGLAGLAGSGKDEAAKALVEVDWERRAFADTLREFLYRLNPSLPSGMGAMALKTVVDRIGWDAAKNTYPEVRRLLQRVGTDAGREVLGENVWVDATFRPEMTKNVVVTDVRFPNEVQAVRARGGVVLRIVRPGVEPLTQADGTIHPSETALDGVCYNGVIHNDTTVQGLQENVREWAAWLERRNTWPQPRVPLGENTGWA